MSQNCFYFWQYYFKYLLCNKIKIYYVSAAILVL